MEQLLQKLKRVWANLQASFSKTPETSIDFASGQTPRVIIPHSVSYDKFMTEVQGNTAVIEVSLDYQDYAPIETHTSLLELVVRLDNPTPEGLAGEQEESALLQIRSEFTKIKDAILVGSVTSGGLYNSYIYLPNEATVPEEFKNLNVVQKYSFELRVDPNWQYYRELLPTLEESERIANQKQLTELAAKGVDLAQRYSLVHVFSGEEAVLKSLEPKLVEQGYQIKGTRNSLVQQGKKDLSFTQESGLDLAELTAKTTALARFGTEQGITYVGWDLA